MNGKSWRCYARPIGAAVEALGSGGSIGVAATLGRQCVWAVRLDDGRALIVHGRLAGGGPVRPARAWRLDWGWKLWERCAKTRSRAVLVIEGDRIVWRGDGPRREQVVLGEAEPLDGKDPVYQELVPWLETAAALSLIALERVRALPWYDSSIDAVEAVVDGPSFHRAAGRAIACMPTPLNERAIVWESDLLRARGVTWARQREDGSRPERPILAGSGVVEVEGSLGLR